MSRAKLTVDRMSADEIKILLKKDEKYMVGVRLYAVYQIANGYVSRDLEDMYNVSFKSVCNWVNEFNKNGIEGLKDKPKSGRKPKLAKEAIESIKSLILTEKPSDYEYNTATWTGPILIDYISKKYGVTYKKAQIYNIMKSMGLSFQKGKGRYPEADIAKQQEFEEELKKTKV
jgi:transposase